MLTVAALTSDDERLQKVAADQKCHTQLISMLVEVNGDEERGELGHDAASRMREGALLALASLCFQYEPTRSAIADSPTSVLSLVRAALLHPSYGVRAAACQLARALSRTVAILRTSLVDSGVGEEVIETLRREVARRKEEGDDGPSDGGFDILPEEEVGERQFTVEVAATATICNLVTDFSPLKAVSRLHPQVAQLTAETVQLRRARAPRRSHLRPLRAASRERTLGAQEHRVPRPAGAQR